MYNYFLIIGRAVFWDMQNACPNVWMMLDYLCDLIYILDSVVHAHEGYLEQGLLVTDSSKLRKHYLHSFSFKLDLLSLLPTDLFYFMWDTAVICSDAPCAVIARLNRLLRLPRLLAFFDKTETHTSLPNAFRIAKVMVYLFIIIHWNGCIYFAISNAIGFGSDGWVVHLYEHDNVSLSLSHQYIFSFYW